MEEKQKFQSEGKLFALKVHAVWVKFEDMILFPFRWFARKVGATDAFIESEARIPSLKVVK